MARALWRRLEAIHAVTYFAPGTESALALPDTAASGWATSPSGRHHSAPSGQSVVTATFYNFSPWRVAKAVPDAWTSPCPRSRCEARAAGSTAALRRAFDGADIESELATAAELAGRRGAVGAASTVDHCSPPTPRSVAGGSARRALARRDALREHRGDGHVATPDRRRLAGRESTRPAGRLRQHDPGRA